MKPRVFTVPPSAPFLPALLGALRDGRLVDGLSAADPLAFAATTIFLPTRRACKLARDAFLDVLGVEAALLPRIVPIGDIDEDELVFADMASGVAAADALDLAPALGGLEFALPCAWRGSSMAVLGEGWTGAGDSASRRSSCATSGLSAALRARRRSCAAFIDDMTTREVPWERLDTVVPDHLDQVLVQITLKFMPGRAAPLAGDPRRTQRSSRRNGATS